MGRYLHYIHKFRGIAILFIIFGHSIGLASNYMSSETFILLSVLLTNGTVLFVFIAGFLFQHLSYKYNMKKYYKSKFINIVIPYFVVSIPAIIYKIKFLGWTFNTDKSLHIIQVFCKNYPLVSNVILFYLTGYYHLGPLWYIPMIIIFYIISPLLIKLDNWTPFYFMWPIFFVITTFVPRSEGSGILQNFIHFFSIYIFGMCFSRYREKFFSFIEKNFFVLTISLVLLVVLAYMNIYTNFVYSPLGENMFLMTWSKLMLSILLIYLLYKKDSPSRNVFSKLADLSFGLFFIHEYVILIITRILNPIIIKIIPSNHSANSVALIIVLAMGILVTFIGCICLIFGKKILGKSSSYILGY